MGIDLRALLALARIRLVLAVAGVAWLFGYSPSVGGRIAVVVVLALVLILDAAAGAAGDVRRAPVRGARLGGAA